MPPRGGRASAEGGSFYRPDTGAGVRGRACKGKPPGTQQETLKGGICRWACQVPGKARAGVHALLSQLQYRHWSRTARPMQDRAGVPEWGAGGGPSPTPAEDGP